MKTDKKRNENITNKAGSAKVIKIVKSMLCRHNAVSALSNLLKSYVDSAVTLYESERDKMADQNIRDQSKQAIAGKTGTGSGGDTKSGAAAAAASKSGGSSGTGNKQQQKLTGDKSIDEFNPRENGVRLVDAKIVESMAITLLNLASDQRMCVCNGLWGGVGWTQKESRRLVLTGDGVGWVCFVLIQQTVV